MSTIEVKASFKNINIKDKTVLQFELSPRFLDQLPELTKMANTSVFCPSNQSSRSFRST